MAAVVDDIADDGDELAMKVSEVADLAAISRGGDRLKRAFVAGAEIEVGVAGPAGVDAEDPSGDASMCADQFRGSRGGHALDTQLVLCGGGVGSRLRGGLCRGSGKSFAAPRRSR